MSNNFPTIKEIEDIINDVFDGKEAVAEDVLAGMGLEPLIEEARILLHGQSLENYEWRYKDSIFHSQHWLEILTNSFALVVRETEKSVFFVSVPTIKTEVSEPGQRGHGVERPDTEAIPALLEIPREQQKVARKVLCAGSKTPKAAEFRYAGSTYRPWDGKEKSFDLRRG